MVLVESFSGIRGIYDKGLDEKVATRYAHSYLQQIQNKNKDRKLKIVIGTDTRISRDILKNAVIEVLDCDIIDVGIASTPMIEFGVRYFKAQGGIIITASHNEPYWNGFKFLDKDGAVLRPKDVEEVIKKYNEIKKLDNETFLSKYVYKNKNPNKISIKKIMKKYNEIDNAYSDYVLSFLSKEDKNKLNSLKNSKNFLGHKKSQSDFFVNSKLKIIIDPNGGTGIIAKTILEKLDVKVHGINMRHGIFNRKVEPTEDSLIYLSSEVRRKKYDFAAGFDCDADRVEIVTRNGFVSGNKLLALIANEILKNAKNKVIVVNDATSSVVKEIAKKHRAKYIETGVGEIKVVDKIFDLKAPIGGEGSSSGVIIPPSRCRDGILTIIYLLKIIADNKKSLDELIKTLPQYYNIKKNIKIETKNYEKIKQNLKLYYIKKNCKIKESGEGSLKIFLNDNSFVWFRASKTEADVLRIIADSPNKKKAESLIEEALKLIKNK